MSLLCASETVHAVAGAPGYQSATIQGMFVRAKTPAALIARIHREVGTVLNRTDVKEKRFNLATEVVASSPEQFTAVIKTDMVRLGKPIKDAGGRSD